MRPTRAAPTHPKQVPAVVMTMHRLTAGAGYKYLLKHTASGDCDRTAATPLTAYYTESGNPPGRWLGAGLAGVDGGTGIAPGTTVAEPAMARLFGSGTDPVSGAALGRAYPVFIPASDRIAAAVERLPDSLTAEARQLAVEVITRVELAKPRPTAVAGFDLTFTPPKSVSTLWAVADDETQHAVLQAHRAAVEDALGFVERTAAFTRTGTAGCEQRPVRGVLATAFDHWDSRAGDPNLHTHLVVANKVQGLDGLWRSLDSRALHHAVVTVSEVYDDLLADHLARLVPVTWRWRHRGPRRSPGFELDGVDDDLMREFSTRTTQIDEAMTGALADFYAGHGRGPNRIEISRLRQQVTRATRPDKNVRPLREMFAGWRHRATARTGSSPQELTAAVLKTSHMHAMTVAQVPEAVIGQLARIVVGEVMTRRSTWTRWNVLAEAARVSRGLRMASPQDRFDLLDRVADDVLAGCVSLEAPDLFTVPPEYQRPDGSNVFNRPGEDRYTARVVLEAEARLLAATTDTTAPVAPSAMAQVFARQPVIRAGGRQVTLAADQFAAVVAVATSGRRIDVLVGPAGTGKTTTLAALTRVWEHAHGRGTVVGLAPSSSAAAELSEALAISCENTAKWLYEAVGPGAAQRAAVLERLAVERAQVSPRDLVRLRTIDTAVAALRAQGARWSMRAGQLVIVDEASLAGTFTLEALAAQACAAGAKVLLVGDHAQLSAVDAGGAFHLLAERGRPARLTSLWRFTNPWEADATRGLRAGDARVLDDYLDHGRVSAGAAEVMAEDAYTAWQADTEEGIPAILIAADSRTVTALNTRAHNDRVTDGIVPLDGVTTMAGTVIGVGDRIVTRANNRRLRTDDGFVRNGDLWDVTVITPDGAMTVTRVHRLGAHTRSSASGLGAGVVLPGEYVAEHVDLGYATTTHRAQGITVDHAHVLAAPGMARENLYVAMTRGRHDNHVYVAVDDVEPSCDYLPDPHGTPDGRDVLERILATTTAELSATQTIAARQHEASSLKRLEPIRQTLLADAAAQRWVVALSNAGLDGDQVAALEASPTRGALFTALDRGEALGYPMEQILVSLVAARPLQEGDPPVADLTDLLTSRAETWLRTNVEDPRTIDVTHARQRLSPDILATLRQLDELIDVRAGAVTMHLIGSRPEWLRPSDSQADQAHVTSRVTSAAMRADAAAGPETVPAVELDLDPTLKPQSPPPESHGWSRSR